MKGAKFDPNYYRLPRNPEWTFVIILMFVFYLTLYHPGSIILDYLGPIGTLARYMHTQQLQLCYLILYAAIAAHAAEAIYTFYVCRKKGFAMFSTFLWTTQTFVFGFPSLLALKAYKGSIILKTQ
ncbi:transmembrane protein 254-like [Dreissena polymorpha]|uniref:transmembrane protein 254-like n=1 Tax=Dreissena polymorpha TaxID=45954 RepID=UPI00226525D4|nr:transmembrane protein 254-like [Dreissena polymorpha]